MRKIIQLHKMSNGKSASHLVDYAPSKKSLVETYDYDIKAWLLLIIGVFILMLKQKLIG